MNGNTVELAFWTTDWEWSFPIIILTLAIHFTAVVLLSSASTRFANRVALRRRHPASAMALSIILICGLGWTLALMHGIEAAVWAAGFYLLGATSNPADSMLYSLDSLTARGASGLVLGRPWRLMGSLEAVNGLLLFGISTAFLATVIVEVRQMLRRTRRRRAQARARRDNLETVDA